VNTVFMDGAVRPIQDAIDIEVWRALGTRGQEPGVLGERDRQLFQRR